MPNPPINVRIVDREHWEYPVDCVYVGLDGDIHVWEVVNAPVGDIVLIKMDVLPAKTEVRLRVELPDA